MSEFQFQKSQRVIVPVDVAGAENVGGVVTGNHAALGREPLYDLQWQSADTAGENMLLVTHTATIAESALLKAQPPAMISCEEATRLAQQAYEAGATELRAQLDLERIHRASKRKAKSARKSRKRK